VRILLEPCKPRWPSGPKVVASLVDEGEWWNKMLGRKKAA